MVSLGWSDVETLKMCVARGECINFPGVSEKGFLTLHRFDDELKPALRLTSVSVCVCVCVCVCEHVYEHVIEHGCMCVCVF